MSDSTLEIPEVAYANMLNLDGSVIGANEGSDYRIYLKDMQGSTSSIVNQDMSIAAAYTYDDFGQTTELAGSTIENEICYTGALYDKATGLYYLNARYYDPEYARFISQDTYRGEPSDSGQWHLYAYCANNPINYYDPSGHLRLIVHGVAKWINEKLKLTPYKQEHYDRNQYNKGVPSNENEAKKKKYKIMKWPKNACHQFGVKGKHNKKYVSPDKHKEVVYNNAGTKKITDD